MPNMYLRAFLTQMRWTHEAKVGLFTVVAVVLLFACGSYVSRSKEHESRDFEVVYSAVDGLQERANVLLAGVTVGFVKSIKFIEGQKVGVTISVTRPDAPLYRARNPGQDPVGTYYTYTINGNSVGDRWIEILPGKVPVQATPLEPGAQVLGERPQTLNELTQKGYQVLSKLDRSVDALALMGNDPQKQGDLRHVMEDFREVAANLKRASGDAGLVVSGLSDKGEQLSDSIETVITRIDQGVLNIKNGDTSGSDVLENIASTKPTDSNGVASLAMNLKDTAASIKKAVRAVEILSETKALDETSIASIKDLRNAAEEIQGIALDLRTTKHTTETERDLREATANAKLALASAARILGRVDAYSSGQARYSDTIAPSQEGEPTSERSEQDGTLGTEKTVPGLPGPKSDKGLIERYVYDSKEKYPDQGLR